MDVPAPFSFAFWVGPAQAVGSAAALYIFCLQVLEGAVAATPVLVAAYLLWAACFLFLLCVLLSSPRSPAY